MILLTSKIYFCDSLFELLDLPKAVIRLLVMLVFMKHVMAKLESVSKHSPSPGISGKDAEAERKRRLLSS